MAPMIARTKPTSHSPTTRTNASGKRSGDDAPAREARRGGRAPGRPAEPREHLSPLDGCTRTAPRGAPRRAVRLDGLDVPPGRWTPRRAAARLDVPGVRVELQRDDAPARPTRRGRPVFSAATRAHGAELRRGDFPEKQVLPKLTNC
jgi:hypothetical protein